MLEMNSKKYSVDALLENKDFALWVLTGKSENNWQELLKGDSKQCEIVKNARDIILLFEDDKLELNDEAVYSLWNNIHTHSNKFKPQKKVISLRKFGGWAAAVLLIAMVGYWGLFMQNEESLYQTQFSQEINLDANGAYLILASGKQIWLDKTRPEISIAANNQLKINDQILFDSDHTVWKHENDLVQLVVPFGKQALVNLNDGTKVWVNAGSRLAFSSFKGKDVREVYLLGEACFDVQKNEKQFIVKTEEVDVTVHGTFFNVSAFSDEDEIETILVEGSVAVKGRKNIQVFENEIMLKPNEKAVFQKTDGTIEVKKVPNANEYTAWIDGSFTFFKEDLSEVFKQLKKYYNVEFVAGETLLSEQEISGKLDLNSSLDEVLKMLSEIAEFNYKIKDKVVYVGQ